MPGMGGNRLPSPLATNRSSGVRRLPQRSPVVERRRAHSASSHALPSARRLQYPNAQSGSHVAAPEVATPSTPATPAMLVNGVLQPPPPSHSPPRRLSSARNVRAHSDAPQPTAFFNAGAAAQPTRRRSDTVATETPRSGSSSARWRPGAGVAPQSQLQHPHLTPERTPRTIGHQRGPSSGSEGVMPGGYSVSSGPPPRRPAPGFGQRDTGVAMSPVSAAGVMLSARSYATSVNSTPRSDGGYSLGSATSAGGAALESSGVSLGVVGVRVSQVLHVNAQPSPGATPPPLRRSTSMSSTGSSVGTASVGAAAASTPTAAGRRALPRTSSASEQSAAHGSHGRRRGHHRRHKHKHKHRRNRSDVDVSLQDSDGGNTQLPRFPAGSDAAGARAHGQLYHPEPTGAAVPVPARQARQPDRAVSSVPAAAAAWAPSMDRDAGAGVALLAGIGAGVGTGTGMQPQPTVEAQPGLPRGVVPHGWAAGSDGTGDKDAHAAAHRAGPTAQSGAAVRRKHRHTSHHRGGRVGSGHGDGVGARDNAHHPQAARLLQGSRGGSGAPASHTRPRDGSFASATASAGGNTTARSSASSTAAAEQELEQDGNEWEEVDGDLFADARQA